MNHSPVSRYLILLSLAALLALSPALPAQDSEEENDPGTEPLELFDGDVENNRTGWPLLSISAGVAYLDADGVLGARPPNSPPVTIINFDRVGLDETDSSHWFSMTWRSRESRWGAWFGNWRYDVTGFRSWENAWEVEPGIVIPVGAEVTSSFDANWYIGELTYSFVQNEKIDAGIGIGLHAVDLETDILARVDLGEDRIEVIRGDLDTLAPLPNVLGYVYWDILPRLNLVTRLGWFGLDYDIYSGQMTNAHAMLSYKLTDRFSIGAAYQFVSLDVDIERKYYREIYDIDFAGPMAYLRFRF